MSKITFLDDDAKDIFDNPNIKIYRYDTYNHIKSHTLWFANPNTWNDPYETHFIDSKYKIDGKVINYKFQNKIFAYCITTKYNCEASWKIYNSRLLCEIDKNRLLNILKYSSSDYDIYIGKINYTTENKIVNNSIKELTKQSTDNFIKKVEPWISLLTYKRNYYSYEKETRIFLILKDSVNNNGIPLTYKDEIRNLFKTITLSPEQKNITKSVEYKKLINKLNYSQTDIKENPLYEPIKNHTYTIN